MQDRVTDDLNTLLRVLPLEVSEAVRAQNDGVDLLEVVLDLGRVPEARFLHQEVTLDDREVTRSEIDYVVDRVSDFTTDNRAGIERTLHRISAIRNRRGDIVGLTLRVGRAVYGTIDIIRDLLESGTNILLLGKPGVGKTTQLREAARVLAEQKRVVVVDTSNEIGGDGDIPHPAIGRARRMQVPAPEFQHEVMIEAVENHMPEVIIIDEIGREPEAMAARTIAERGVQLVGTAHGQTLENLLQNPTLADLVGGIQAVTLSDEEARRRGTQKTVLERKAPPTFDVLVEIKDRQHLVVHHDVAASVDALLRGRSRPPEIRYRDESGKVKIELPATSPQLRAEETPLRPAATVEAPPQQRELRVYAYGVGKNRLRQAAQNLHLPVDMTEMVQNADAVLTLKNYYRRRPQPITDAEKQGVPIYVLRSNTVSQMESVLADIFGLDVAELDPMSIAMRETEEAIQMVLQGQKSVDLSPRSSYIRRLQHQMAREANLVSHSYGKDPRRHVRIFGTQRQPEPGVRS
ncbi:MAG TPA: R3H domain-containing nucleic acid-binding protein [Anaerolineae bacterium]|nr:R3H domain-containing nucleic acid-binding protein [Anaerolineae bacterium]